MNNVLQKALLVVVDAGIRSVFSFILFDRHPSCRPSCRDGTVAKKALKHWLASQAMS